MILRNSTIWTFTLIGLTMVARGAIHYGIDSEIAYGVLFLLMAVVYARVTGER